LFCYIDITKLRIISIGFMDLIYKLNKINQ
jgi:hypothetical protein